MSNCRNKNCGCKDTYLTTPPPCPTPVGCPDPQPCSEVFPAECIIYTGADIECNDVVIVTQNSTISTALTDVINYFCTAGQALVITSDIVCGVDTVVAEGVLVNAAIEDVVTYFCNVIDNLPAFPVNKYTDTLILDTMLVVPITHNLNSTFVTIQLIDDVSNTLLIHGTHYTVDTYTANTLNVSRIDAGGLTRIVIIG